MKAFLKFYDEWKYYSMSGALYALDKSAIRRTYGRLFI